AEAGAEDDAGGGGALPLRPHGRGRFLDLVEQWGHRCGPVLANPDREGGGGRRQLGSRANRASAIGLVFVYPPSRPGFARNSLPRCCTITTITQSWDWCLLTPVS